ncbi:MAG: MG2 domain-containing protein [Prevotella sp.]|nr:MG2 domain-containing protein [Prevotella sp.]MCM1436658.1 MG2 domain-containing protein [Prevotella sp.]
MNGKLTKFTGMTAATTAVILLLGIIFPSDLEAKKKRIDVKTTSKNIQNGNDITNSFANPDFAFPKDVISNAEKGLREASKTGNPDNIIKAAIQLTIANDIISSDRMPQMASMLDSIAMTLPSPQCSVLFLLEAKLFYETYCNNSRTFNNRNLPLDNYPANPQEWSSDLFALKIMELIEKANSTAVAPAEIPISEIRPLLVPLLKNQTCYQVGFARLSDFIAFQANEYLSPFLDSNYFLPLGYSVTGKETIRNRISQLLDNLDNVCIDKITDAEECQSAVTAFLRMADRKPYWEQQGMFLDKLPILENTPAIMRIIPKIYRIGDYNKKSDTINTLPIDTLPGANLFSNLNDFYTFSKAKLEIYPDTIDSGEVNSLLEQLSRPVVTTTIKGQLLSSDSLRIEVSMKNANSTNLLIYKTTGNPERWLSAKKMLPNAQLVRSIPVSAEGVVPFTSKKELISAPLPYGTYFCIPSSDGTQKGISELTLQTSPGTFLVSDMSIISSNDYSDTNLSRIFIVDGKNQKPLKGVKVTATSIDRSKKNYSYTTDEEGAVSPCIKGGYEIIATKGDDKIYSNFYNSEQKNIEHPIYNQNIYTDLGIYKPGQKIQFAIILSKTFQHESHILPNEDITVTLSDANNVAVDTLHLTTDNYGRCTGTFTIPESGLLGSYHIRSTYKGQNNYSNVEVAEYKAPLFIVTVDKTSNDVSSDSVTIIGKAMTYSGMPVENAKVTYNVKYQNGFGWWRRSVPNASFASETTSDSEGKFKITLDTSRLKGTPYQTGLYTLSVDVTDSAGETESCNPVTFSLGEAYRLDVKNLSIIPVTEDSIIIPIRVLDILGKPVERTLEYILTSKTGNKKVIRGKFPSGVFQLSASGIPSGQYSIQFCMAENPTISKEFDFTLFRSADSTVPCETPLWMPQQKYTAKKNDHDVKLKFGSGYDNSYILCQAYSENHLIWRKWIKNSGEMTTLSVPAPAMNSCIFVTLTGMHSLKGEQQTAVIYPYNHDDSLEIQTVTFRDKITPGAQERWSFHFNRTQGQSNNVAALAVMTNDALNAISPFEWSVPGRNQYFSNTLYTRQLSYSPVSSGFMLTSLRSFKNKTISIPEIYTYNMPLYPGSSTRLYRTTGTGIHIRGVTAETEDGGMVEDMVYASANATPNFESMKMAKYESAVGVFADEQSSDSSEIENGSVSGTLQLRDIEHPLAFFMPNLSTDQNGNIEISFTVPNFNTTWDLQLLGYTPDMLCSLKSLQAVSSKPMMVQTNVPRFLRTGDTTTLIATIFNNTDQKSDVSGRIEIFNPLTDEIINSINLPQRMINAGSSINESISFAVPENINYVGIRSIAESGSHTDGEQTLIPILPSSSPVIESTPFYLGINHNEADIKLPKTHEGESITLQFCDNPAWVCLTALPDITFSSNASLTSKLTSLYGSALANGLVKKMPQAKKAIELWLNNPQDSVLLSPLLKNPDLKILAISETPWLQNASSETLRMIRLGHLLDTKANDSRLDQLLKDIISLQNKDGGFSWCPGMKSGLWVTQQALQYLGMLNHLGYLPEENNLYKSIDDAIQFCDREIVEIAKKNGKIFPITTMLNYFYIRSFFKTNASGQLLSLHNKTLTEIQKSWRDMDIYHCATAAILLARNEKRNASELILKSLTQRALTSETSGMWFDNLSSGYAGFNKLITTTKVLEAFCEINPESPCIDMIRQWLILQKQTGEWGNNPYTAEIVNAILTSGSEWTSDTTPSRFFLNGEELQINQQATLTGEFTIQLNPKDADNAILHIEKSGKHPAWGGVISQFVLPSRDVKEFGTDEISIKKSIYVIEDTPGDTYAKSEKQEVGQRVRVTLTVTTGRDLDYVTISDNRPACFFPVNQISGYTSSEGLFCYREIRNQATNFFFSFLPKGVHQVTYDCFVDRKGDYTCGIADTQSLYAPTFTAHSSGGEIHVGE